MPSVIMPVILIWESWWDYFMNKIISPLLYYPLTVSLKFYAFWSEHVFVGLPSYCRVFVDCLYNTLFHAVHGTLAYCAHYTLRTGNSLNPDEFDELVNATWAMLIWYTMPFKRNVVVWSLEYEPFKVLVHGMRWDVNINTSMYDFVFDVVGYGDFGSEVNVTLGSSSSLQDFFLTISDIPTKVPVILDGIPDTRCAYWTYPFWSGTFSYHLPTCWAISRHMVEGLGEEPLQIVYDKIKDELSKQGVNVKSIENDDKEQLDDASFLLRLCCAYRDKHFGSSFSDNPIYYAWIAAKPTPMCTHFISSLIEDIGETIADAITVTGQTISDIIHWFLGGKG